MAETAVSSAKMVFTFPGQGSYHQSILAELYERYPYRADFVKASEISQQILGQPFLPLIEAPEPAAQQRILNLCPELDQVAIFLTEVLIARILMESGVRPDLVLGHSFGELAALAVGGVYSVETGLRIVCQRSAALHALGDVGKMAAASCDPERASQLIQAIGGKTLQIAVANHARQTVISGSDTELNALRDAAALRGVNLTVLRSRYPFHSSLLRPAVEPFRMSISPYRFQAARIPVYLGTANRLYGPDCSLADILADQFTTKLDFAKVLRVLYDAGHRHFIECGAGEIVTGITLKSLGDLPGVICMPSARPAEGVKNGMGQILKKFAETAPTRTGSIADPTSEVSILLKDVHALLERTSDLLRRIAPAQPEAAANPQPSIVSVPPVVPERAPVGYAVEVDARVLPIAIVSMGCVLPGSRDPEEYWNHIENGISGIVDLARADKSMAHDFLSAGSNGEVKIVPDKTYTLLHGSVGTITYDPRLFAGMLDEAAFHRLTRGEKLLALATAQSLAGLKTNLASYENHRVQCVLGSTADGSGEYDDALFLNALQERLQGAEADPDQRTRFSEVLRKLWTAGTNGRECLSQHSSYQQVLQTVLGRNIRMYVVDAACSSSLYAINLGMKALQNRTADVVFAGGVFAPGPANNTLFAQFRGLTPTASRPLDSGADGVVFGDGAGVLVLKRLDDAMEHNDRIVAVIRSIGVSSDGKSPAINVPQAKGQSIAIRRAYETSGIDVNTIQYVEAHATGTPVGDAVEFSALQEAMPRRADLPAIDLGSVKSLVGHTGWAAGVASVIKICKALEKRTVPRQYNYSSAGPEFPIAGSQFSVATQSHPWAENIGGCPRRAAINGFGFGGTNAHLVLEAFDEDYHRKLRLRAAPAPPLKLAVIGTTALFPAPATLDSSAPSSQRRFQRQFIGLPKGKMLLPDVRDHMDASQSLAALAAERVLSKIADRWPKLRNEIGVVLGVESKTERGMQANERIFLDRLKRRLAEYHDNNGLARDDADRILNQLIGKIRKEVIPSGPYTLPGLMPNVVAGRVTNMFDLNGPNIVVDMGASSLFQSIAVAAEFLAHKDSKIMLAGGLNAASAGKDHAEAVFMMAMTTLETAQAEGLPIEFILSFEKAEGAAKKTAGLNYGGAQGIVEIADAIATIRDGRAQCSVREPHAGGPESPLEIAFHAYPPRSEKAPKVQPPASASTPYSYVQGTPIDYYTPVLVPAEASATTNAPRSLRNHKLLFVTDQPDRWLALERAGAFDGLDYRVLCPIRAGLAHSVEIDLESEEKLAAALERFRGSYDVILAVKGLDDSTGLSLLTPGAGSDLRLLDLLFAVCRNSYADIQEHRVWVATVCLNAFRSGNLDPYTGLLSGFVKSLARELPDAVCRTLNTDERNFKKALQQVELELTQPADSVEVCYQAGVRKIITLAPIQKLANSDRPWLDSRSVVLATGGGRGVTAALAEELLARFGCTVIALGRTDPAAAPPEILAMDEAALSEYEPQFYKDRLAKSKEKKITELRREYHSYQAAHEVHATVQRLSKFPGRYEYISADITDREAVGRIVDSVFQKHGRVDLVLHGAGIQVSKVLTKKSVHDFRSVVAAKLASLRHIYEACGKHGGRPVHYHLLTSAFSYMGNDGQPDYGAANEAMNRIAALMSGRGEDWSSLAWLGWAGIGMTRGSEFAALAASRRLRGVTKEEGRDIFSELLRGPATAPINVLMASGEIEFYNVKTVAAAPAASLPSAKKNALMIEREVSIADAPFIEDHLVDGIPTMPGAFLIMLIAEAALELRPNLKISAFENAAFRRFVRMRREGATQLRLQAKVISEDQQSTLVRVAIVADFVHKSGRVLQKDVEQTAISVRLAPAVTAAPRHSNGVNRAPGRLLDDPYVMGNSPVRLNGPFRAMKNIMAGELQRSADYKLLENVQTKSGYRYFLPNLVMLDALWRFGAIHVEGEHSFPIYVPEACKVMKVYYDFANPDVRTLTDNVTFAGANPHQEDDRLMIGPVEARDAAGSTLIVVDGGLCRRLGEARNGS